MIRLVKNWLPVVLWAGLIFSFSSMSVGKAADIYWKDFLLKKTAHLVEYSVLCILTYRALISTNLNKSRAIVCAILFSIIYAISDEFHQSFVPGREPRIRDVVIDTIGASVGIILWTKKY